MPKYLLANRSRSGIFMVMWFKDGKFFTEPKREKKEMIKFLDESLKKICEEEKLNIKTIMIDASIRLFASNRKIDFYFF